MKAKKKPFKKFTLADLGLEEQVKPRQEILKVAEPPKREGGAKVRDVSTIRPTILPRMLILFSLYVRFSRDAVNTG